jgi:hypothetical protein
MHTIIDQAADGEPAARRSAGFASGQEFRAPYPFCRTTYDVLPDDDGEPVEQPTWKPGVEWDTNNFGDSEAGADAVGEVVFTVIAVFKPGSYPPRVFFLRNWIDPDGRRFGRNNLRMTTQQNFRKLIKGYRHDYEISETA